MNVFALPQPEASGTRRSDRDEVKTSEEDAGKRGRVCSVRPSDPSPVSPLKHSVKEQHDQLPHESPPETAVEAERNERHLCCLDRAGGDSSSQVLDTVCFSL